MKNSRIMVAVLAASALGLTASAGAQAEDMPGGDTSQEAAETTENDRQQRRVDRRERREQRPRRAAREGDSDTAENNMNGRQQRRADRGERQEQRPRRAARDDDGNTAETRRSDRNRRYADRRDGDAQRTNHRRSERRHPEDRQARRDRRQNRADRSEAGRHARWRDRRDHREFNRRDFGHARGERRKVAYGRRWDSERPRTKHRAFDNRVDRRLDNLRKRTRAGWRDGEITHRELERVRKDRRRIARMDRRFGSDGRYTKRERRKLNNALDRASNRVYRTKHNDRVAWNGQTRRHRR